MAKSVMSMKASSLRFPLMSQCVLPVKSAVYCVPLIPRLTVRRRVSLGISGTQYTADFTGNTHWLISGNLNDDAFIDITDFAIFVNRLNTNYGRSEERRVGKECRSRWSP